MPEAESGYNPHADSGQISIAVGESRAFVCTDPAAESGDSQGRNSIALLKSQQTFQQRFYSCVGHPVVLETLLKSLLRFQQSY